MKYENGTALETVLDALARKFSSRKFWAAVVGFVTAVMNGAGASSDSVEKVAAIITAGGVMIGYMIAEGLADSGRGSTVTDLTGIPGGEI